MRRQAISDEAALNEDNNNNQSQSNKWIVFFIGFLLICIKFAGLLAGLQ